MFSMIISARSYPDGEAYTPALAQNLAAAVHNISGNGAADELASSRLNIASVTEDLEEAEKLITDALAYYVTPEGSVDIHRFTALAALAELCFRRGDYREAGRRFEETARAWREMGLAEQRRAILLRNALYSYESAEAREDAERVRVLLREAGG